MGSMGHTVQGFRRLGQKGLGPGLGTQRAHYSLNKEYSLALNMKPLIFQATFLT